MQLLYCFARNFRRRGLLLRWKDGLQLLDHGLNGGHSQHCSLDGASIGGSLHGARQSNDSVERIDANL